MRRLLLPALLSLVLLAPPLADAGPGGRDAAQAALPDGGRPAATSAASDTFGLPAGSRFGSTFAVVLLAAFGLLLVDQRGSTRRR